MAQVLQTEDGKNVKDLPLAEGEIRPQDTVTVYATKDNPYSTDGAAMVVHPELARKLVAKGFASDKEPIKTKKAE